MKTSNILLVSGLLGLIAIASGIICSKRFVGGKWITTGDCEDGSAIINDMIARARSIPISTLVVPVATPVKPTLPPSVKNAATIPAGNFCSKRFVGGKWITNGECEDQWSIINDLESRVRSTPITTFVVGSPSPNDVSAPTFMSSGGAIVTGFTVSTNEHGGTTMNPTGPSAREHHTVALKSQTSDVTIEPIPPEVAVTKEHDDQTSDHTSALGSGQPTAPVRNYATYDGMNTMEMSTSDSSLQEVINRATTQENGDKRVDHTVGHGRTQPDGHQATVTIGNTTYDKSENSTSQYSLPEVTTREESYKTQSPTHHTQTSSGDQQSAGMKNHTTHDDVVTSSSLTSLTPEQNKAAVLGLKCNEGFNATIMEVPFYHWKERECKDGSECFTQEMRIPLTLYQLEARVRYGGCISSGYSKLLKCSQLFGEQSNLDPSLLFNMLPGLDSYTQFIQRTFDADLEGNFRTLFSNGTGLVSFIDGFYTLMSNLGLNTEKALPLRKPLAELLELGLPRRYNWVGETLQRSGPTEEESKQIIEDFLNALQSVTDAYKIVYPESAFPDIVWEFAQFLNATAGGPRRLDCGSLYQSTNYNYTIVNQCYDEQGNLYREHGRDVYNGVMDFIVDLQFAIFTEVDIFTLDLYHAILEAFPDYEFIVKLMRMLDREDIKEIFKSLYRWNEYPTPRRPYAAGFFEKFVGLTNVTVAKISAKLGEFNKELRKEFSPRSCKFDSCKSDLCNTHERLTKAKEFPTPRHPDMEKKDRENIDTFQAKVNTTVTKDTDEATTRKSVNTTHVTSPKAVKHVAEPIATTTQRDNTTSFSGKINASYLLIGLMILLSRKFT